MKHLTLVQRYVLKTRHMRKIIVLSFVILLTGCATHLVSNSNTKAQKDASGNLVGIVHKKDFLEQPYRSWFAPEYEEYKVNEKVVLELKNLLKDVKIKAFMGTWCGDSKRETPKLYKLLDKANFNYKNLEFIAVDRQKKSPKNLQKGYDIRYVPTFIFYKKGKEIGRFVEYAIESFEEDLIKILKEDKMYKNPYSE